MQAAYMDVEDVRELVARLSEGARPLLLAATGTNGRGQRAAGFSGKLSGLRSRLQLVK
jgi:hypothetical protein